MTAGEVIIARYRLLRRLGVGGVAEAFEAVSLDEGRGPKRVCVKRLLAAQAEDPEVREAFHREAHLLEALDHSKIVRVLDHFSEEGSECMVLELVNGVDLRALLAHHACGLPADEVEVLAVDLLRALEHAHAPRAGSEGIVHRDVSSSNVLVSVDGEARLTDFGIAKELEGRHAAASIGIRGKIPYMAPEQMRGERTSAQTDLFALGVVLHEALTGRRPFDGAHDVETMTKILANERPALASLVEAPRELIALIELLLAFEPGDRPPSAGEALGAFGSLREEPTARLRLGARAVAVKPTLRTYTPLPFVPSTASRERGARPQPSLPETRAHVVPRVPSRSRRAAQPSLVAAALTLVALGALIVHTSDRQVDSAGVEHAPPEEARHEPEAEPDEAAVELPTAPDVVHVEPAEDFAAAPDGSLRVVVIPWGSVWIDGVPHGRAPRIVRLSPGPHWVGAGIDAVEKKKRVQVRAGATRTVELDLSGG
jgi:eukaryotic-like serine/threonine-protein kinase